MKLSTEFKVIIYILFGVTLLFLITTVSPQIGRLNEETKGIDACVNQGGIPIFEVKRNSSTYFSDCKFK